MKNYLSFTIKAPLMSFGNSSATGTIRTTDDHPTKSAVICMTTAASGFPRKDPRIIDRAQSLMFACAEINPGWIKTDYQTISPITNAGSTYGDPVTRAATIEAEKQYLEDAEFKVFLWPKTDYNMQNVLDALNSPIYDVYFGRKCCEKDTSLFPEIIKTDSLLDAFKICNIKNCRIFWEGDEKGLVIVKSEFRHDDLFKDRTYGKRVEYEGIMEGNTNV